jgi:hypothetical protein
MRFMPALDLPLRSRYGLACSILLMSLACHAQAPQVTQSCNGDPAPPTARKSQPAPAKESSPVAATANPMTHTIRLSWTESVSPASTVQGYYIYRRETGPSCQTDPNECEPLNPMNPKKPVTGNGCTDYSVVSGHTYTYQARTVGKNSLTSTSSNDATATAR